MKTLILIIMLLTITACQNPKYEKIGQEIIDGKVSATQNGSPGRVAIVPKIWVQTPTTTKKVEIPFAYEGR